jgi:hypothetical protein
MRGGTVGAVAVCRAVAPGSLPLGLVNFLGVEPDMSPPGLRDRLEWLTAGQAGVFGRVPGVFGRVDVLEGVGA